MAAACFSPIAFHECFFFAPLKLARAVTTCARVANHTHAHARTHARTHAPHACMHAHTHRIRVQSPVQRKDRGLSQSSAGSSTTVSTSTTHVKGGTVGGMGSVRKHLQRRRRARANQTEFVLQVSEWACDYGRRRRSLLAVVVIVALFLWWLLLTSLLRSLHASSVVAIVVVVVIVVVVRMRSVPFWFVTQ